ncbi:hypothetical protein TNCV_4852671 [Trichonephila clavipes]|nr:hypothetical protein TNCV_4852671 [Trichonephila clavipes]
MLLEPGFQSVSLRPVSIAMSSLRKIEKSSVSQFSMTGIVLGLNIKPTARMRVLIPAALSIDKKCIIRNVTNNFKAKLPKKFMWIRSLVDMG